METRLHFTRIFLARIELESAWTSYGAMKPRKMTMFCLNDIVIYQTVVFEINKTGISSNNSRHIN